MMVIFKNPYGSLTKEEDNRPKIVRMLLQPLLYLNTRS